VLNDFIKPGSDEKRYRVYEPVRGEIIEKSYSKKGEEEISLKGVFYQSIVLEETDHSTGTRATVWLNKADGMIIKTLVAGRNIYLTDSTIGDRIRKVNFDSLIFARVNKVIPDFFRVNYMKVRARIESYGEVLTVDGLNFPGQKFTGTVQNNLVEGIFELEPKKYDGSNAPSFPPDLSKHPEMNKYLEPEMAIESNEPVLIREAKRITAGSKDSWEAAVRLSKWVAHNIEGAIPGGGNAVNTYKMRQGECGGHSRLLVAFCRAVGIPARISVGCLYTSHFGGSFGQHAWTEIHMGEAGWIAVDATAFQTDFLDAGHIRLGERAAFQPKEMEILEYRTDANPPVPPESVPPVYRPYLGKYTDLEKNRVFQILYRDNALAIDIPNQTTLQLEEPDSAGQWYPKLSRQISVSFVKDPAGKVEMLAIRQKLGMPKLYGKDSIPEDVPVDIRQYLGVYSLPRGVTREVTFSDGCLVMFDPVGKTQEFMKYSKDGETWKEKTGRYAFTFESGENNAVARMILYITSCYPKGEPAADLIGPVK
jgi:transglutaminase-like putative cysteine protease